MKFTPRTFAGLQDRLLMSSLARSCPASHLHVTDLPYRLSSWALDEPGNAALWFDDGGHLVGWVVLQTPFCSVDIVCCPAAEAALYPQMLAWADERARSLLNTSFALPAWYVNVFTGQDGRIRDLERAGYECQSHLGPDSWSKVLMERPGGVPVRVYEPRREGFVIRPLAGQAEVEKYVDLHRAVFGTKNMTAAWRGRILQHPDYLPELDIVVAAPGGRLASFCICWFDRESMTGQVEPLGCHQDFRALALGRVALSAGLHRLQDLGARTIRLETDNYRDTAFRLYESFGFQVIQDVLVYKKGYQ